MWGLEKFRFYLYGKKVFLKTDHQAFEPLTLKNRCNRQKSARLSKSLDRLAHFDIAIQHFAGSNLKFTDFLSRYPVESVYNEQYVINILSGQPELNQIGITIRRSITKRTEEEKTNKTKSDNQ